MTLAQLKQSIEQLPDNVVLQFPVKESRDLVSEAAVSFVHDLTAAQVGALPGIRRSPATVRRWQKQHPFPGAFRDPGGEWRFPPETVQHFLAWYRAGGSKQLGPVGAMVTSEELTPNPTPPPRDAADGDDDHLSDWRREC